MKKIIEGTIIEFNQKYTDKESGIEVKIFCRNIGTIFAGKKASRLLTNMTCKIFGDFFVEALGIEDYFTILLRRCFVEIKNNRILIFNNEKGDKCVELDLYELNES